MDKPLLDKLKTYQERNSANFKEVMDLIKADNPTKYKELCEKANEAGLNQSSFID